MIGPAMERRRLKTSAPPNAKRPRFATVLRSPRMFILIWPLAGRPTTGSVRTPRNCPAMTHIFHARLSPRIPRSGAAGCQRKRWSEQATLLPPEQCQRPISRATIRISGVRRVAPRRVQPATYDRSRLSRWVIRTTSFDLPLPVAPRGRNGTESPVDATPGNVTLGRNRLFAGP